MDGIMAQIRHDGKYARLDRETIQACCIDDFGIESAAMALDEILFKNQAGRTGDVYQETQTLRNWALKAISEYEGRDPLFSQFSCSTSCAYYPIARTRRWLPLFCNAVETNNFERAGNIMRYLKRHAFTWGSKVSDYFGQQGINVRIDKAVLSRK